MYYYTKIKFKSKVCEIGGKETRVITLSIYTRVFFYAQNQIENSFQLRIIRSKSRGCARKADNLHKNQTIRKRIRRLYFIFFERKIDMQYHNIVDGDNTIPMGIVVGVDVLSDPLAAAEGWW